MKTDKWYRIGSLEIKSIKESCLPDFQQSPAENKVGKRLVSGINHAEKTRYLPEEEVS